VENTSIKQPLKGNFFFISVILLSGAALILSSLSLYDHTVIQHTGTSTAALCNISEGINCNIVNQSKWSYLFGIPIASLGIFFYSILTIFAFFALRQSLVSPDKLKDITLLFATFSVAFSIYLFFVSKLIIGSLCLYCLSMYLVNFLLFIVSICARKGVSFFRRISGGLLALKDFFLTVVGIGLYSSSRVIARSGFAGILSLGLFIYFLPNFLVYQLITVSNVTTSEARTDEVFNEVIVSWESQEMASITYEQEGVNKDHSKGESGASIQLVKFSDFQCPGCRQLHFVIQPLLDEYPDHLQFVLKNFPLDSSCNPLMQHDLHRHACYIAKFTRCAGEQEAFWPSVDYIFSLDNLNHRNPDIARKEINEAMSIYGLDGKAMQECLEDERHTKKIVSDIMEAERLDLQGTPTIWVNGKRVLNPSPENLRIIFDYILEES